jgi:hypothetical protein
MNKNNLSCYYLLEATFKTLDNNKIKINELSEEFRNEILLQARKTAFTRFNELVFEILDGNSINFESGKDAYSKLQRNFLNPIILKQQPSPKRLLPFTSQKQFLTLSFIFEYKTNVGDPKQEIFSKNSYTIFGIRTSLFITDYIDALMREKALYKYFGFDTGNEICKKKLKLDSVTQIEVDIWRRIWKGFCYQKFEKLNFLSKLVRCFING